MGAVVGVKKFIGDSWEVNGWVTSERIEREDTNPTGYAHANNLKRELESGQNCDWLTPEEFVIFQMTFELFQQKP